jgi:predicted nucleic acid-binding protein
LSPDILRVAETIEFHELHDRLILATAKWLGVKIISSDSEFRKVEGIEVLWD